MSPRKSRAREIRETNATRTSNNSEVHGGQIRNRPESPTEAGRDGTGRDLGKKVDLAKTHREFPIAVEEG